MMTITTARNQSRSDIVRKDLIQNDHRDYQSQNRNDDCRKGEIFICSDCLYIASASGLFDIGNRAAYSSDQTFSHPEQREKRPDKHGPYSDGFDQGIVGR